jgi:hypothetical protein
MLKLSRSFDEFMGGTISCNAMKVSLLKSETNCDNHVIVM